MSNKLLPTGKTEREEAGLRQCRKRNGELNYSRQTGDPCGAQPMKGVPFCKTHGGRSLRGTEHPRYKHGLRTQVENLPEYLRPRFEAALADEQLFEFRNDAALTEARMWDIIATIDETGLSQKWKELRQLKIEADGHERRKDVEAWHSTVKKMMSIVESGADENDKWNDVERLQRHKIAIASAERRRRIDEQHMITVEQMAVERDRFVASVLRVIEEKVGGEKTRELIGSIEREYRIEISRGNPATA